MLQYMIPWKQLHNADVDFCLYNELEVRLLYILVLSTVFINTASSLTGESTEGTATAAAGWAGASVGPGSRSQRQWQLNPKSEPSGRWALASTGFGRSEDAQRIGPRVTGTNIFHWIVISWCHHVIDSQAQTAPTPQMIASSVPGLHHMQQLLQQHVLSPTQLQTLMKQHSLLQQQQHHQV